MAVAAKRPQYSVVVLEASDRLGGNITTQAAEGFVWELGPNSFAPTPALLQLIAELGLQSELIRGDRHLPRYIYWRGHLYPLEPTRPLALATSNLLSPWGKVRAALGALGFVPPIWAVAMNQFIHFSVAIWGKRWLNGWWRPLSLGFMRVIHNN